MVVWLGVVDTVNDFNLVAKQQQRSTMILQANLFMDCQWGHCRISRVGLCNAPLFKKSPLLQWSTRKWSS